MALAHALPTSSTPAATPHGDNSAAGHRRLSFSWRTRVLTLAGVYGVVCLFFATVWLSGSKDSLLNVSAEFVHLLIWLTGAMVACCKLFPRPSRHWTAVDGLVAIFGLAFLFDAAGGVLWLTYNLHGNLVPFPSWADVGFGGYSLLWAVGMLAFFWVLDTNVRDELGPFVDILAVTWSLTVVIISLINGSSWATLLLPKVALDIFYPFVWALNSALAGSLLFGAQHRRLQRRWQWFVGLVYAGSVVTFLTNIAYALTAAAPAGSAAAKYLYYDGGPLDFLFATGDFLLVVALVVLPMGQPARSSSPRRPQDYATGHAQPSLEHHVASAAPDRN